MITLSQSSYIDKVLKKFAMYDFKKGEQPSRPGITLSLNVCLKTYEEKEYMAKFPYALVVGSLMYAMICTRPNVYYVVGIVSRY